MVAYLRFGYAENGFGFLNCTSRQESCVSVSTATTFSATDPFRLETSESASYTPIACSSQCMIQVPAISGRVLYSQPLYNTLAAIKIGPVSAVAVP